MDLPLPLFSLGILSAWLGSAWGQTYDAKAAIKPSITASHTTSCRVRCICRGGSDALNPFKALPTGPCENAERNTRRDALCGTRCSARLAALPVRASPSAAHTAPPVDCTGPLLQLQRQTRQHVPQLPRLSLQLRRPSTVNNLSNSSTTTFFPSLRCFYPASASLV